MLNTILSSGEFNIVVEANRDKFVEAKYFYRFSSFRLENINVNDDKRSLMKFGSRFSYRYLYICTL